MDKKISVGIKAFSIINILTAFIFSYILMKSGFPQKILDIFILDLLIFSTSIGILYYKKIAMVFLLLCNIVVSLNCIMLILMVSQKAARYGIAKVIIVNIPTILYIIFSIISVRFFLHPEVKKQFK